MITTLEPEPTPISEARRRRARRLAANRADHQRLLEAYRRAQRRAARGGHAPGGRRAVIERYGPLLAPSYGSRVTRAS